MLLVRDGWLQEPRGRAAVAAGGCAATALLAVVLTALSNSLLVALAIATLGIGLILLLTQGIERSTHLVMTAGMFFAPLNNVRVTGFVTVADLLFVVGFGLLAPVTMRQRLHVSQLYVAGWLIMIVIGIIASVVAPDVGMSFNLMTRFLIAGLVLPTAFMLWRPEKRLLVRVATAYLAGAAFSTVYSVTLGAGAIRPMGLTTHPNFFGLTTVLGAALVPYIVGSTRRRWHWCVWLAGVICAYGVWISGSRAAFVALGAMVVIYTVRESSVLMGLGLGLAGTILLLFLDQLDSGGENNALSRILGGGSAAGSDWQREQLREVAMERFHAHPILGNGFEHAMEAHSIYLQVLVSVGVIGLVGYLLVFAAMVQPLLDTSRPNFRLAYPALTYALVGLFTNSLWDRFVWAVLALSMAGVVIDNHREGRAVQSEEQLDDLVAAEERA